MSLFSWLMFQAVQRASRRGLRDEAAPPSQPTSPPGGTHEQARQTGVRGETYAYWYLRRHGYVFVARNYMPQGAKGEIDLIGYDGAALAFVEVRARTIRGDYTALPELSVTEEKRRVIIRTAQRFLRERHIKDTPARFDVLAIDNRPGLPPVVRLHKNAFGN
jgi:Holliday junction resolvase-like predicted endonuclease